MTIQQAEQELYTSLVPLYETVEARAITQLAMEHLTGMRSSERRLQTAATLTSQQMLQWEAIQSALLEHQPIQYVMGKAWFYNMELMVNNAVLIPRPETEELVQWILEEQPQRRQASILDIGTGSGCIPIAIKKNWPAATVSGLDVSADALVVAQQNATLQQTPVEWHQANILEAAQWPAQQYDIIVSNPPYIPQQESRQLDKNVTDWEPHLALFVPDNDPLLFYNAIADFAQTHLQPEGSLYFECHQQYVKQVLKALQEKGFTAEQKTDMFGNERMVKAVLKP